MENKVLYIWNNLIELKSNNINYFLEMRGRSSSGEVFPRNKPMPSILDRHLTLISRTSSSGLDLLRTRGTTKADMVMGTSGHV